MEEWRDIAGYEGFYQVSDLGNVKSVERVIERKDGKPMTVKEKVLKPRRVANGGRYDAVLLCKNGSCLNHRVHILVARAFVANENNKPQVNHIDGNRYNNSADNLEWVTAKENMRHAISHGLISEDAKREANRANMKKVKCSNGSVYESINAAARDLGVSTGGISEVINGQRNHCGGYSFEKVI